MTNISKDRKQIVKLASQLLDDTIDELNFLKLEALLTASSENRQFYLEVIRLESLLHWEHEADQDEFVFKKPKIIAFPLFSTALSAAAVFVALMVGWWAFNNLQTSSNYGLEIANQPLLEDDKEQINHDGIEQQWIASSGFEKVNSQTFSYSHPPEKILNENISRGVKLLQSEQFSDEFGSLDQIGPIRRFSRVGELSRPTERGVLPAVGNEMIALSALQVDVDSKSAELTEMIQILDVRDIATNIATGEVQLNAEAMFNQSFGACQDGAEFALSFHAFRGQELSKEEAIGSWESSLACDVDPQTWESLISSVQLPSGTEFVIVAINVRKSGNDAFVANTSNYYSDDFRLSLQDGEQVLIPVF